jgi:hypothetical protein
MNKATVERRDSNKCSSQNSCSVAIVGSLSEVSLAVALDGLRVLGEEVTSGQAVLIRDCISS